MKWNNAKNPILVLLVVAGLAAGTALVSGFADKPVGCTQVTSDSACNGCPLKGTPECCQETGSCAKDKGCVGACEKETCKGHAGGCCRAKADEATCTASGCSSEAKPACGMGGCTLVQ